MISLSDAELIWALQQENAKLRNVTAFYANKKNYVRDQYSKSFVRTAPIDRDGGQMARKALEGTEHESIKVV